jgi:hypothetical protein
VLKNFFVIIISFVVVNAPFLSNIYAQDANVEALVEDTKTDLLIVISGGLGGAILGLSTLSFVDEPKKHTRNIIVGSSIGIIAGVAFVAYNQANKSQKMFYTDETVFNMQMNQRPGATFNTYARNDWHHEHSSKLFDKVIAPLQFGHTFTF